MPKEKGKYYYSNNLFHLYKICLYKEINWIWKEIGRKLETKDFKNPIKATKKNLSVIAIDDRETPFTTIRVPSAGEMNPYVI